MSEQTAGYESARVLVGSIEYEARYLVDAPFGYPDDERTEVWRDGVFCFCVDSHPRPAVLRLAVEAWVQAARPDYSRSVELAARAMAHSQGLDWEALASLQREQCLKMAALAAVYFVGLRPAPSGV